MAEAKQQMNRHLRSARQWLSNAEKAFDKDHDVRGELDLLLAQAELQHAKEVKSTGPWRLKSLLLQHGLALGLAVTVATVGVGGAYWLLHERDRAIPIPLAGKQQQVVVPAAPLTVEAIVRPKQPIIPVKPKETQTADDSVMPAQPAKLPAIAPQEPDNRPSQQIGKEMQLPPDEMQKLIRAAGKSLRGEE
jgi:hypothetical protein